MGPRATRPEYIFIDGRDVGLSGLAMCVLITEWFTRSETMHGNISITLKLIGSKPIIIPSRNRSWMGVGGRAGWSCTYWPSCRYMQTNVVNILRSPTYTRGNPITCCNDIIGVGLRIGELRPLVNSYDTPASMPRESGQLGRFRGRWDCDDRVQSETLRCFLVRSIKHGYESISLHLSELTICPTSISYTSCLVQPHRIRYISETQSVMEPLKLTPRERNWMCTKNKLFLLF